MTYKPRKPTPVYLGEKEIGTVSKTMIRSLRSYGEEQEAIFDFRGLRKGMRVQGDGIPLMWGTRMNHHAADKGGRMYLCACAPGFRIGIKETYPKGAFKKEKSVLKNSRFFTHKGSNIKWFLRQATKFATP